MRHQNKTKQLSKTHSHRKAMFSNMATSLFMNESIITTKDKAKVLKSFSEKLITKAKKAGEEKSTPEMKLHKRRTVMKFIKDEDAVAKLFDDIAVRNKDRKGGYTRIYLIGKRPGDAAEKAIVELVEKK
ncbi:MAG TPA: 50S ribosomal protein L17 [Spirochaetota bacterium]|nr:50S ribosomal protein L17 [Spirochaetota bacterium]HPM33326.1 50S ribosomal protein L17 [Spirochaetota bacterium]